MINTINEYRKKKEDIYNPYIAAVRKKTNGVQKSINTGYGSINLTIYYPSDYLSEKRPVYFNFHGGGFILGFYEQDGMLCQEIARKSDCIVVNIDYLLAPENKFPIPVISSAEVIIKFLGQEKCADGSRTALGGFSAGGNLAVSICLYLKEKYNFQVKGLVSVYAPLDFSIDEKKREVKFKDKAILPDRLTQYKECYFNNPSEYTLPLGSPVFANPQMFPPALVLSAEYDSLCAEEAYFSKRLKEAGIPVQYRCFKNATHGYTHEIFDYQEDSARETMKMIVEFLNKQLL